MKYNVYISGANGPFNLLDINEIHLEIVIKAYLEGKTSFALSGKTIHTKSIVELRIFINESGKNSKELKRLSANLKGEFIDPWEEDFNVSDLEELGREITDEKIGNSEFGERKIESLSTQKGDNYISTERIDEFINLTDKCKYDLSKLIRICREINDNFSRENYYSVSLLQRTLLNHIPPAFGKDNFDQIIAERNGNKHKTEKEIFQKLNEILRKLSDLNAHEKLRSKEPSIAIQEIDFRKEVDFLLKQTLISLHSQYLN